MTTLQHNLAGELASLYVNYLSSMTPSAQHNYFKKMWNAEYQSRLKRFVENPNLVDELNNSYNEFYKTIVAEKGEIKRRFCLQS